MSYKLIYLLVSSAAAGRADTDTGVHVYIHYYSLSLTYIITMIWLLFVLALYCFKVAAIIMLLPFFGCMHILVNTCFPLMIKLSPPKQEFSNKPITVHCAVMSVLLRDDYQQ